MARTTPSMQPRLNLLKKILASTLGVFQKASRQARLADSRGGEGAWVGRPRYVRLALISIVVSLHRGLDQLQQLQSNHQHRLSRCPANIALAPANSVSLDVGSATQNFTASPKNRQEHRHYNTGCVPFQQHRGLDHRQQWTGLRRHLGFGHRPANLHPRPGWRGPGNGDFARRQQSAHHGLRASAYRQDRDQCGSRADSSQRYLLFEGTDFQLSGYRPSRALDITASVGTFTWQSVNPAVATLDVAYRQHARTRPGGGTGQGRRATAGTHFSVCRQQQCDQSASRFQHLRRAVDRAGSQRRAPPTPST